MASHVKQVYYLPYAYTKRPDLAEWWVVYQVSPRGYIPPYDISDDSSASGPSQVQEFSFFQNEGLDGTFVIDLNIELDNATPIVSDEITDPKDLEFLSKLNTEAEDMDDNTYEDDEEDQDEDDYDLTDYPAYDPNDY